MVRDNNLLTIEKQNKIIPSLGAAQTLKILELKLTVYFGGQKYVRYIIPVNTRIRQMNFSVFGLFMRFKMCLRSYYKAIFKGYLEKKNPGSQFANRGLRLGFNFIFLLEFEPENLCPAHSEY